MMWIAIFNNGRTSLILNAKQAGQIEACMAEDENIFEVVAKSQLDAAEQEIAQLKAENLSMFNTINAMHDALHQAKREYTELHAALAATVPCIAAGADCASAYNTAKRLTT